MQENKTLRAADDRAIDPQHFGAAAAAHDDTLAPPRVWRQADGRWATTAPAKLNLGLRVFPKRADGHHALESWMVGISWHDSLWYLPGPQPLELQVTGRAEGVPTDVHQNLVGRACLRLAEVSARPALGRLILHKVVPPGGGLGGGSSDAANALNLLKNAWDLRIDDGILSSIAAELGSDVPFFLTGEPSLCTGRGEIMSDLRPAQPLYAVLILPVQGLSTKLVYGAFDSAARASDWTPSWAVWSGLSAEQLNTVLRNDLESPAFVVAPWLGELKRQCQALAGQMVHMTGSGSTLFTLCSSGPHAARIAASLRADLTTTCECVPVRILRQP